MEHSDIEVEGTPNPNAAKFVVDETLASGGSRSYFDAEDAGGDTLAERYLILDELGRDARRALSLPRDLADDRRLFVGQVDVLERVDAARGAE